MPARDIRILESAVKMELDGRKFYLKASKTAKNVIAKKLLVSLADQELTHIDRIKEISEGLKHEKDWGDFEGTISRQSKKKLSLVFRHLSKTEIRKLKADPSNIKVTYPSDIPIAEAILKSRPSPKRDGPIGPYAEAQW